MHSCILRTASIHDVPPEQWDGVTRSTRSSKTHAILTHEYPESHETQPAITNDVNQNKNKTVNSTYSYTETHKHDSLSLQCSP